MGHYEPDESQEKSGDGEGFRRRLLRGTGAAGGIAGAASGVAGTALGAAGGGVCDDDVVFCEDWSDGDYTSSPSWEIYLDQGDFSAEVRTMADVPQGGQNVLHVSETLGGGTDGVIGWADGCEGWNGEWTLRGLFYTQELNPNIDYQKQVIMAYYDGSGDAAPIEANIGFTDPGANLIDFSIDGSLIDTVEESLSVDWTEDTWYHYEFSHDGAGTYTGRLWEDGDGRPASPNARSVGAPPGTEGRVAAIDVNGAPAAGDDELGLNHAFMRWVGGRKTETESVQAATATTVAFVPGLSENDEEGGNDNWSVFPNGYYGPPVMGFDVDPTRMGDKLQDIPDSLGYFAEPEKTVQYLSGTYKQYRVKNSIAVGFESSDGQYIDDDSISVLVNVNKPEDGLHDHSREDGPSFEVRHFNEDSPERMVYSLLEEDEIETLVELFELRYDVSREEVLEYLDYPERAHAKERHASAQKFTVERDGEEIEGVRVATVFAGVEPYVDDLASGAITEFGRSVGNLVVDAPPVAYVYSWVELTVLADGTKIFRMPDASVMPKQVGYFEAHDDWEIADNMVEYSWSGDLVDESGLRAVFDTSATADRSEYEIAVNEDRNHVFDQWYHAFDGNRATPYHSSRLWYLFGVIPESESDPDDPSEAPETPPRHAPTPPDHEHFGQHPVMEYGTGPNGEELSSAEICTIIEAGTGSTLPLSPFHMDYQEAQNHLSRPPSGPPTGPDDPNEGFTPEPPDFC